MNQFPGAREASAAIAVDHAGFDPLGPCVQEHRVGSGRLLRFVDDGQRPGPAALFFGGAGTSVRAVRLLEFARSFREELGVRLISVERNGLGLTPYDPTCGPREYADDVWALVDALAVERVAVVAISGGGPYAASVMAAHPERVASVHLACAYSDAEAGAPLDADLDEVFDDPVGWWAFPPSSAVHAVPGFVESATEEATHALHAGGRKSTSAGLRQAFDIYRHGHLPDLSRLRAPAYLYWGTDDAVVPARHLDRWERTLPGSVTRRLYPGAGHDVQYRHWDQILTDIRYGGSRVVVSHAGRTWLLSPAAAEQALADGATLGISGWSRARY